MSFELPTTISQMMTTDVVSLEPADNLSNLIESMKALRFRHLPVTEGKRLVGLLTERDILRLCAEHLLRGPAPEGDAPLTSLRVRDVMVRDVVTVSPETPVTAAGKLMLEKRLGCLLVVNAANELAGIVTQSDFVTALTNATKYT